MFTSFSPSDEISSELDKLDFELGHIEKTFESKFYQSKDTYKKEGIRFHLWTVATTTSKYAYVHVMVQSGVCDASLCEYAGAVRSYIYHSNTFGGPILGRKVIKTNKWGYDYIHYIINNPYYKS